MRNEFINRMTSVGIHLLTLAACAGMFAAGLRGADEPKFTALSLDDQGWKRLDSYGPDNPWDSVPRELQKFGGVPFFLTAKMQFHGLGDARDNRFYPMHVKGLAVNQRAARLHVLHGCNMSDTEGKPVAAIRLNFAGGSSHTLVMNYGVHTRDWWKHKNEKESSLTDTNSVLVWTGTSVDAEKIEATHRLFKTTFDLPASEKPVETIDVFSLFSRSAFVLLGLTIEAPGANANADAASAAPSADLSKFREELIVEVSGPGNVPLGGARIRGAAQDSRRSDVLLGRMDDSHHDSGVVPVDFPAGAQSLELVVTAGPHGPAALEIKRGADGRMPSKTNIQLAMGQRIRGTVLTPEGEPLPKARVYVVERRAGAPESSVLGIELDDVTTDAQGIWRTQIMPERADRLTFRVSHADYTFKRYRISEKSGANAVTPGELLAGEAKFQLTPSIKINGLVMDPSGAPLPRANVTLGSAGSPGSTTSRTSDSRGRFTFSRSEPGELTLVVRHTNYAPFIAEVTLTGQAETMNVRLRPGTPFRGRVMEAAGADATAMIPLSGATINVTEPKTKQWLWSGRTDAEGRFEWSQAPEGPLQIVVRHIAYLGRTFSVISSTNETQFLLGKGFFAWGNVANAETRQPVGDFTVTTGTRMYDDRINWQSFDTTQGKDGWFFLSNRFRSTVENLMVKVEATGYHPRLYTADELGWRSNRIELRPGTGARGVVKLPDGKPAGGAELAVIGEGHVSLQGTRLTGVYSPRAPSLVITSDQAGRFELPFRLSQRVVAVHEQGYGETTLSNIAEKGEVTLEPWGRIEGVVRIGSKPAPGAEVRLSEGAGFEELAYARKTTKTDDEGRFRFVHVPPGVRWLGRLMSLRPGYTLTAYSTPVTVEPGKLATATVGGTGRPVIGRVVLEDASRKVAWNSGNQSIYPVQTQRAGSGNARGSAGSYPVIFTADGAFRADDLPAGSYRLGFSFHDLKDPADPDSGPDFRFSAGFINHEFEIAPMPGGRSDEPLDLGKLELKNRRADAASR